MRAWITPDSTLVSQVCYLVYVPDDDLMRAAFAGAMNEFGYAHNWQNVDGITEEEAASAWGKCFDDTFPLVECSGESGVMVAIGSVLPFASDSLPDGCLWCDGSFYDTSTYPSLFDVIGYTWGQSGSQFAVPNMGNAYPKGAGTEDSLGDMLGSNAAKSVPVAQHTHNIKKAAASGTLTTAVSVGIRTDGAFVESEPTGSSPAVMATEGQRAVFNWYIVATAP